MRAGQADGGRINEDFVKYIRYLPRSNEKLYVSFIKRGKFFS